MINIGFLLVGEWIMGSNHVKLTQLYRGPENLQTVSRLVLLVQIKSTGKSVHNIPGISEGDKGHLKLFFIEVFINLKRNCFLSFQSIPYEAFLEA